MDILRGSADDAATSFVDKISVEAATFIPRRQIMEARSSRPWITDACREAVAEKARKQGTADYDAATQSCSSIMGQAYREQVEALREKIKYLPKSSNKRWSLKRQLVGNSAGKLSNLLYATASVSGCMGLWRRRIYSQKPSRKSFPCQVESQSLTVVGMRRATRGLPVSFSYVFAGLFGYWSGWRNTKPLGRMGFPRVFSKLVRRNLLYL